MKATLLLLCKQSSSPYYFGTLVNLNDQEAIIQTNVRVNFILVTFTFHRDFASVFFI